MEHQFRILPVLPAVRTIRTTAPDGGKMNHLINDLFTFTDPDSDSDPIPFPCLYSAVGLRAV